MAGGIVTVWTDAAGRLAHPPLSRADVAARVIGAVVATVGILALLLGATGRVVALVLDRHRPARWEAEWSAVEPRWTGMR